MADKKEDTVEVILPTLTVRTPDDAVYAYLNGHIDEKQLRDTLGAYGVSKLPATAGERVDAAYERKIPDDLFEEEVSPYDDYKYRMSMLNEKTAERDKAAKAAEKEKPEETVVREDKVLTEKNVKRS